MLIKKNFKFLLNVIIFLFLISNLLAKKIYSNSEELFAQNNLISTYVSSYFLKLPKDFNITSDNFAQNPNNILFNIIRDFSKKNTLDMAKFKEKEIEVKFYQVVDKLKTEIFPYSEKFNTLGLVFVCDRKIIGACLINKDFIFSIDGGQSIQNNIGNDKLETFFEDNKFIKLVERDKFLKNLQGEEFLLSFIKSINDKNLENFYSYFSLKYKFSLILKNFIDNSFNFDIKNLFFGKFDDIESVENIGIKPIVYNPQFNANQYFEINLAIKEKKDNEIVERKEKFFILLSYSKKLGYRINDIKKEN